MSSNKAIAKNTLFLYFRMLFNMGVALYTSRVVLKILGIADFGIYNLVGGVVVLFSFLNGSMGAATQRFINFEKATLLKESVKKIFNISITNHLLISATVLVLAETFGLWFLNQKLNIPEGRIIAANIVYQISLLTALIDIMRVPYNSMIIAYERMSYYAYLGIFETVAKLIVSVIISWIANIDHLVFYAVLIMLVNLGTIFFYYSYCRNNFKEETTIKYYKDKTKLKEMLSFSGWMLFGQLAVVGANQGIGMIFNIFYGVILNAAMGIAMQVNASIYGFVGNFQTAFNPQVIQSYASKEVERHKKLILTTSKFSFFLIAILSAPILLFPHFIMTLWLGHTLPKYVEAFVQLIILCSLIDALAGPFWMSAAAIGSIKEYNIVLTCINLCTLPLAYVALKMGFQPTSVFIIKFFIAIILQLFRFYFVNKYLHFAIKNFVNYIIPIIVLFLSLTAVIYGSRFTTDIIWANFIIGNIGIEVIILSLILMIGFSKEERTLGMTYIKKLKINFSKKYK